MNFIDALFSSYSNSLPAAERIAGKKYLFRIDDELEIQKFVYGYFLDSYKGQDSVGKTRLDKLSRYEYFAGSLTCRRLIEEIKGFLQSAASAQLQPETRKIIEELLQLFEESLELNHHVDLFRSSERRCCVNSYG
jgi:hypothetical protein